MEQKYEKLLGRPRIPGLQVKPLLLLSSGITQKLYFNRDSFQCEGAASKGGHGKQACKQTEHETAPCADKRINSLCIRCVTKTAGCAGGLCPTLLTLPGILNSGLNKGPRLHLPLPNLPWRRRVYSQAGTGRLKPSYPFQNITALKISAYFNCCLFCLKVILRSNTTKFKA